MKISEICITLRNEEKLKAFVNITFDNCFVVRGVKVIQGANGYFVSMPSRKKEDGSYRDVAHPTNLEMRKKIEEYILKAYAATFAQDLNAGSHEPRDRTTVVRNPEAAGAETWSGQLRQSG